MTLYQRAIVHFLKENGWQPVNGIKEETMLVKSRKQVNIHGSYVSMFYEYIPGTENYTHIGNSDFTPFMEDLEKKGVIYYFITQ